jgi:hypothetical protein
MLHSQTLLLKLEEVIRVIKNLLKERAFLLIITKQSLIGMLIQLLLKDIPKQLTNSLILLQMNLDQCMDLNLTKVLLMPRLNLKLNVRLHV